MSDDKQWGEVSQGAFLIITASITGLCLIAKIWMIRKVFDQDIDVNSVIIPSVLQIFAGFADSIYRSKKRRDLIAWNNFILWGAIIVIATILSLLPYR